MPHETLGKVFLAVGVVGLVYLIRKVAQFHQLHLHGEIKSPWPDTPKLMSAFVLCGIVTVTGGFLWNDGSSFRHAFGVAKPTAGADRAVAQAAVDRTLAQLYCAWADLPASASPRAERARLKVFQDTAAIAADAGLATDRWLAEVPLPPLAVPPAPSTMPAAHIVSSRGSPP